MGRDDRQVVTGINDGWRSIDDHAPRSGRVVLANADKTIAWESYDGVGYEPYKVDGHEVKAAYWRIDE